MREFPVDSRTGGCCRSGVHPIDRNAITASTWLSKVINVVRWIYRGVVERRDYAYSVEVAKFMEVYRPGARTILALLSDGSGHPVPMGLDQVHSDD